MLERGQDGAASEGFDTVESAGSDFCKGLQYLIAAARVEGAGADDKTRRALDRLAAVYRERAVALMTRAVQPVQ